MIRSFRIARYCPEPVQVKATAERGYIHVEWESAPEHIDYTVAHRVKGAETWAEVRSTFPSALLSGVRPGYTYEYRVGGFCEPLVPTFGKTAFLTLPSEDTTRGKIAMIGRSMGNAENPGVKNIYQELKKTTLDVEIFDESSLSGEWNVRFNEASKEFASKTENWTKRLSNQELMKLKMYELNKEWAKHLVDEGYTILDLGDFNNLGFSVFYSMEIYDI